MTKAKDEKGKEIESFVENMQAKLQAQLKSKLLTLIAQKGAIADEVKLLEDTNTKTAKDVLTLPPSSLILKSNEIVQKLKDIHQKPTSKYAPNQV